MNFGIRYWVIYWWDSRSTYVVLRLRIRIMRMKHSAKGLLVAHMKGLTALIKDLWSYWLLSLISKHFEYALKIFHFIVKKNFHGPWRTLSWIFKKFLNRFQQTRSQMKAYHFSLLFRDQIKKNLKNVKKCVFMKATLFLIFVFCQHICSILTNDVSNERIWYPIFF